MGEATEGDSQAPGDHPEALRGSAERTCRSGRKGSGEDQRRGDHCKALCGKEKDVQVPTGEVGLGV